LRMLAYSIPVDLVDDNLAMGESKAIMWVKRFVIAIVQIDDSTYLRSPNAEDTAMLLEFNSNRWFLGILGSIDSMHWRWKNCPAAWHGQFKEHKKDATIILKAITDHETWIWHAFFWNAGVVQWYQRSSTVTTNDKACITWRSIGGVWCK
jgi:hypothetical protein